MKTYLTTIIAITFLTGTALGHNCIDGDHKKTGNIDVQKHSDEKIISTELGDKDAKPSLDDLVVDKDTKTDVKDQDNNQTTDNKEKIKPDVTVDNKEKPSLDDQNKQMTGLSETDSNTAETSTDAQSPIENDS